ncbi:MAG: DUF2341 domain-containing protein [Candidatus Methanospirareceae archaeon]
MRMTASRAVMRARRICVCVVVAAALLLLTTASAAAWWNSSWKYRRTITIQSDSELTDFQVLVVLDSTNFDFSKAKSDGGDVRFVDEDDATKLSYWIEEWDAAAETAKIWVKVPSIPAGNKTIYIYYNNSEAVSESDGDAVFEFFDDFEDGVIDTSKWTVISGDWMEENGYLKGTGDGSTYARKTIRAEGVCLKNFVAVIIWKVSQEDCLANFIYRAQSTSIETADRYWARIESRSSYGQGIHMLKEVGGSESDLGNKVPYSDVTTFKKFVMKIHEDEHYYEVEGVGSATTTDSSIMNEGYFGFQTEKYSTFVDVVCIAKYASPEPSVSVGAEEEYTPPLPQDPNLQITCVPPFTLKISLTTAAESGYILIGLSPSKYAYAYPHHGSGNYTLTATFLQTNITYYCVACGEGGENCTNVTAFTCECAEELVEGGYDTSFRELLAGGDLLNVTKLGDAVPDVYRSLLGDVFWALFFGGIFVAFWIRQEDVMLPSIVGLVCGGAMLMLLPPSAQRVAYILLVISIAGTLYSIIKAKR